MTLERHILTLITSTLLLLPASHVAAAIESTTTIAFDTILSAHGGAANVTPVAGGNCPGSGFAGCYYEDGIAIGTLQDITNPIAHVHGGGGALSYHADAPGIYLRALDGSAFALLQMDFHAPISAHHNPGTGVNDLWEILGFDTAIDASLPLGNGTDYATRVAYQTVANGFDGVLTLDAAFANVNAVWIHYKGYPLTPLDGKQFELTIDNVVIGAAVTTPIPLPALPVPVAFALLGGLIGFAQRRSGRAAS